MAFIGTTQLTRQTSLQTALFKDWIVQAKWRNFWGSGEHFDWWTFPIDANSDQHGDRYNVTPAIDEAFEYADFTGQVLSAVDSDDGTHISFELPTEIPVHDVEVLIEDEGKALEIEVPSCTIDGVQTLVELLWGPNALLAVRFNDQHMNFDNKRIIALDAPKSWHFPIHYLM